MQTSATLWFIFFPGKTFLRHFECSGYSAFTYHGRSVSICCYSVIGLYSTLSVPDVSCYSSLQFHPCYIPVAQTFIGKLLVPVLSQNQISTGVYLPTSSFHKSSYIHINYIFSALIYFQIFCCPIHLPSHFLLSSVVSYTLSYN